MLNLGPVRLNSVNDATILGGMLKKMQLALQLHSGIANID